MENVVRVFYHQLSNTFVSFLSLVHGITKYKVTIKINDDMYNDEHLFTTK